MLPGTTYTIALDVSLNGIYKAECVHMQWYVLWATIIMHSLTIINSAPVFVLSIKIIEHSNIMHDLL